MDKYTEGYSLVIVYKFSPDETTNHDVFFSMSVQDVCKVYQTSKQLISEAQVVFEKNKLVTITIISEDRAIVSDSIIIAFKS